MIFDRPMTRCPGMTPRGGTGCLKMSGHELREQPACRNGSVTWCSLCDEWDCEHVTIEEQAETVLEREKRRASLEKTLEAIRKSVAIREAKP